MCRFTYATKPIQENDNGRILAGEYVCVQGHVAFRCLNIFTNYSNNSFLIVKFSC